jgi:hypothetical protein
MKLIHAVTNRITRTVLHFGEAKLVRDANGCHELIGGTVSDLVTAKEWVSLFAHEMVFYHSKRTPKQKCNTKRHSIPPGLKQQRAGFSGPRKISTRVRF